MCVYQWAWYFEGFGVHFFFFCTKNSPNLAFYDFFSAIKKERKHVSKVCVLLMVKAVGAVMLLNATGLS